MDFGVGLGGVLAGMLEDDYINIRVFSRRNPKGDAPKSNSPSTPPGCSGAKWVKSQTWPSTTIQQSWMEL